MAIKTNKPHILYEDTHIIVCVKPAGIPAQPDRTGAYDLTSQLLNHLAEQERKAGKTVFGGPRGQQPPYLAVVHRLDRPVGGVMVFAKTKRAAAELSRQVQEHQMTKRYFCVLTGLSESEGSESADWQTRVDYLTVDKRTNLSHVAGSGEKDAQKAELRWRLLESGEEGHLAEVELLTGRHHQIRLQMTQVSQGLWGDTKYNPAFAGKKGWYELALFSHELAFTHPATGKQMHFTAVPESSVFDQFGYIQRLRER